MLVSWLSELVTAISTMQDDLHAVAKTLFVLGSRTKVSTPNLLEDVRVGVLLLSFQTDFETERSEIRVTSRSGLPLEGRTSILIGFEPVLMLV